MKKKKSLNQLCEQESRLYKLMRLNDPRKPRVESILRRMRLEGLNRTRIGALMVELENARNYQEVDDISYANAVQNLELLARYGNEEAIEALNCTD